MSELQLKGKKTLLALSIISLILDISSVLYSRFELDSFVSVTNYITSKAFSRMFIYTILIFFCYKGYLCAKWILCLIILFSGLILIFQFNILGSNLLLGLGVSSIIMSVLLFISKPVKAFMSYQISN